MKYLIAIGVAASLFVLFKLNRKVNCIMVTTTEATEILRGVKVRQEKTINEIDTLQTTVTALRAKVDELTKQLGDTQNLPEEMSQLVQDIATLAERADNQIPDLEPVVIPA